MEARQKTRKDKTVVLFDRIEPRSVEQAVRRIIEINNEDRTYIRELERIAQEYGVSTSAPEMEPISLVLSTQGGSCYDGMALYNI